MMNSTAMCVTWRGMGSVKMFFSHDSPCDENKHNHTIPDWLPPRSRRTARSAVHQDRGVKYAPGASSKIRGRDNITIGIWNTRTLRVAGKLQELTYEMDRYSWNMLGLCEMRWKNFGKITAKEGHKVFFSGKGDEHEHGIGFLVTRTS